MIGVETVWVRAFNKWMPTGYVEGDREARRDDIDRLIALHNADLRKAFVRRGKIEFYPRRKVRIRAGSEALGEDEYEWVPKRRPGVGRTKAYRDVVREIAQHAAMIEDLRREKASTSAALIAEKAQRRAEFLRALMLTPEWIKAQCDDHKRREFKYELDSLCNDDERAQKTQYSLAHQYKRVDGPSPERELQERIHAHAMRAQAVEPPTWMERFRRWLLS